MNHKAPILVLRRSHHRMETTAGKAPFSKRKTPSGSSRKSHSKSKLFFFHLYFQKMVKYFFTKTSTMF
jgi:hypothetical protein